MNCHGPLYVLAEKWLFWPYVMACSTTVFWYGLHVGKVPYSEKMPWKPHPVAALHDRLTAAALKSKTLWSTDTFCVFHRQSSMYGCLSMLAALHDFSVTVPGSTRVQYPPLVLAAELQKRLAFSHRTTPLQLLMNVLCEITS